MYPRSIKTKHRRAPTFPTQQPVASLAAKQPLNKSHSHPGDTSTTTNGTSEKSSSPPSDPEVDKPPPLPPRQRYNSSYHSQIRNLEDEEEKENKPTDIFDISPGKAIDYEQRQRKERERERDKEKDDFLPPEIDLVRTKSEHSLASSGSSRSTPEPTVPLYFRSVRSLKNKDKGINRELRKSRSLQDLTSDEPVEEVTSSNLLKYRSRSRDDISNLGRSGESLDRWSSMEGIEGDGSQGDGAGAKPKTFFESLMNPEPQKQKPPSKGRSHSAYLKLASIPRAKHIDQYVPNEQAPARKKSAPDLTFGMSSLIGRNKRPNGSFSATQSSLTQNSKDSNATSLKSQSSSQPNTPNERTAAYISSSTPRPYVSLAEREREYRSRKDSGSSTDSLRRYDSRMSNGSGSDRSTTPTGILKGNSPPLTGTASSTTPLGRSDLHNRGPLRNETDELKMARSSSERKQYLNNQLTAVAAVAAPASAAKSKSEDQPPTLDDLMFTKKGWLLMLSSNGKEWFKHWFVLTGNALKYYRDAKAEDANFMSGVIDLSTCYELAEVPEAKNYGFRLKTTGGDFTLSAMTAGIRTNWMQAVQKCADTNTDGKSTLDSAPSITSMSLESWASRLKSLTAKSEGSNHVGQVRRRSENEESRPANTRHYSDDDSDFPGMRLYRRQSNDSPPRRKTIGSEREREAIADAAKTATQAKHPVYKRRTSSDEEESEEVSDAKQEDAPEDSTEFLQEITDLERNISGLAQRAQEENKRARSESSERELSKTEEEKSDSEGSGSATETKAFHFRNSSDDLEKELDRRDGLQRRSKSPANKAPSAKVLEKSRSKSPKPRMRSKSGSKLRPSSQQEEVEKLEASVDSAEAAMNTTHDAADKMEDSPSSSSYQESMSSRKPKDGETILVELLEAEIADIQDEMEHKTGYLHAKLSEQNNKSEMTKLQVTTLKTQLKEAKDTVEEQQAQILELKEKLEVTTVDLTNTEAALTKSINEWKEEKSQMERLAQEWQATEKLLAEECKKAVKRLKEREEDVRSKETALKTARSEIKKRDKHIEHLEHQVKDVRALEREVKEKTSQLAQVEKTLADKNQKTNEFERKTKKLEEMEQKLGEERRLLESRLKEAEQRLQNALKQSSITDSMNSNMMEILHEKDETIAQLEERLIENDSKIDDLLEEIAMEVQANNQFQENLDQSVSENLQLKERLSAMQEEIQVLHKDLDTTKTENAQYQNDLEKMESIFQLNDKAYSSLLTESTDLKTEMALLQGRVKEQEEIIQQLSQKQGDNALTELKVKYDKVCAEVSKLNGQLKAAEAKVTKTGVSAPTTTSASAESRSEVMVKEYPDLKKKFERTRQEVEKLQQLIGQSERESVDLKAANKKLKSQLDYIESEINGKIDVVSGKVEELCSLPSSKSSQELSPRIDKPKKPKVDYENITQELESQIHKIENRLKYAESFLKSQKQTQQVAVNDTSPTDTDQAESLKHARKRKSGNDSRQSSESELSDSDSASVEKENPQLMAKIRRLKKKTTSLESKLQDTVLSLQAFNTDSKKVRDLQSKLTSGQLTLDNCQTKLDMFLQDLASEQGDMSRGWVTGRLQDVLEELKESDCKQLKGSPAVEHRLRVFAEKLALEAILLGEADYIIRGRDTDTCSSDSYWKLLQETRYKLEEGKKPYKPHKEPFAYYAVSFAERLMENGEISYAIDRLSSGLGESADCSPESQVFTTEIDAKLYKDSSPNSLVHSEIFEVFNRLKQQSSYHEKLNFLETELKSVKQRLCEKENELMTAINGFRSQKLKDLVNIIDEQSQTGSGNEAGGVKEQFDQVKEIIQQNLIQAQLAVLLHQSIQNTTPETEPLYFEFLLKNEVENIVLSLESDYHSPVCELHPGKTAGDLVALRVVVNGLLVCCASHLHKSPDRNKHVKLSARDSGVSFDETKYPFLGPHKGSEAVFSLDASQKSSLLSAVKDRMSQQVVSFKGQLLGDLETEDITRHTERLAQSVTSLDFELFKDVCSLNDSASMIAREAVVQAQLKYLTQKVKCDNEDDVLDVKDRAEKEKAEALEELKMEYEEKLEMERVEYTQSKNQLRDELDELKSSTVHMKGLIDSKDSQIKLLDEYKTKINSMEQKHKENLHTMKEKHDKFIHSLKQEIQEANNEINKLIKTQENIKKDYEEKIKTLGSELQKGSSAEDQERMREELDRLKEQHQIEMEEMKTDMRMALKSVRDQENRMGSDLQEEITRLRQQIEEEQQQHQLELDNLQSSLQSKARHGSSSSDPADSEELQERIKQLEQRVAEMQDEYERELKKQKQIHQRELGRCKEDLVKLLTSVQSHEVDEASVRRKYEKEIDKLKDVCDQGLAAMEKSHQKVMKEIRETHRKEVEILQKEKEHALDEETKATQSALDAMRKAHEAQLEEEKNKMQEKLAKVFSDGDLEDLRQEYEDDLNMVREEVKMLSEQYSIKCLEKSALEERLEAHAKMLKDSRKHLHELMESNEALSVRLDEDIGGLKSHLQHITQTGDGDTKETEELKVAIGVRDIEIQQLKEELEDLREQLQEAEDAQDETADKYNELYTTFQAEKANHELEVASLKENFEKLTRDRKREEGSRSRGRERNRREPRSPRSLSVSPEPGPQESSDQSTKSTPSGRKRSSKAYELRRSQSTPGMPVSQLLDGRRDSEGRVIADFPRSGPGLSVAERMKKFQK